MGSVSRAAFVEVRLARDMLSHTGGLRRIDAPGSERSRRDKVENTAHFLRGDKYKYIQCIHLHPLHPAYLVRVDFAISVQPQRDEVEVIPFVLLSCFLVALLG